MTLVTEDGRGVDVERATDGALPSSPDEALERWSEVHEWAASNRTPGDVEIDDSLLGPPSPTARTAFGVGFNYAGHIEETGAEMPEYPTIFAKLFASLAGPFEQVPISTSTVDWEVELAVVIGRRARRVAAAEAWDHVAGLTVAQDLSDRGIQLRPREQPQFTLGKSLPGFCPTGPYLVTADEFEDPDDLELSCTVNGEEVQHGRTSEFIFSVSELIEYLSEATELMPGDLILTGTPAGIGATMDPPRFLSPGDVLESAIPGIGRIRQEFVEDRVPSVAAGS
ncbi:MAG: fumarylacetoacetate hydrolase family protein [Solirubrobacterales bacterium]